MKVIALDVFAVREGRSGRSYVWLKISTDEGLAGWSEIRWRWVRSLSATTT